MTKQERKDWLIQKIAATDDENIINEVYAILEASDDDIYQFSEAEEQRLAEARLSLKEGKSKTQEQLKSEVTGWLQSMQNRKND